MYMNEMDNNIIKLLQVDGRASNAKIAREVGVSEGTVRRRLRRLIQDNVIHVIAVPNLEQMGFGSAALIGVQVDPGRIKEVADAISALNEAHYVAITLGSFDIFAWVGLESAEQLGVFVRAKIHPITGVRRTETFVNETIRKRTYGLIL